MKKYILILFAILLLGASLRFYEIGSESLWTDELFTLQSIKPTSASAVIGAVNYYEFHNPPLYYLLLYFWSNFFGTTEFALRSLSALFGTLSILIIFLIGNELFDIKTGLISALICSISIMDLVYSQELRSYTTFSFFVLLSSYLFILSLKKERSIFFVFYTITSSAMIYTLPFGFIILFLQNLFILLLYKNYSKLLKKWYLSQLFILLLFIPQIPSFLLSVKENYLISFELFVGKLGAPEIFQNTWLTSLSMFIIMMLIIFVLFYFKNQAISFFKRLRFSHTLQLYFFFVLLVISIAYMSIASILIKPFFLTRYSLFFMPAFYILIAAGISHSKKILSITSILMLILASIYPLFLYYSESNRQDWRGAINYLEDNLKEGDIVVLCPIGFRQFCTASDNKEYSCPFMFDFRYYYKSGNELVYPYTYNSGTIDMLKSSNYWVIFSPDHRNGKICEDILDIQLPSINKTFKRIQLYYYSK